MSCYFWEEEIKGCSKTYSSLVESEHDTWNKYDHRNHKERERMGSGEADARRVDSAVIPVNITGNSMIIDTISTTDILNWNYTQWPTTIYKYQIFCPKAKCKAANWLELDQIKPCVGCGAKLKAVSEQADYEIPVVDK